MRRVRMILGLEVLGLVWGPLRFRAMSFSKFESHPWNCKSTSIVARAACATAHPCAGYRRSRPVLAGPLACSKNSGLRVLLSRARPYRRLKAARHLPNYLSTLAIRVPIREGSFMKFRPLHDRVVVRRLEQEEKTAGRHHHPDTAKEKPQEGEVVAVGPGAAGRGRQASSARCQSRRPRAVRQVVGHRGQDRRRGAHHHEGKRHHGRHRGQAREGQESRLRERSNGSEGS